MKNPKSAAIFIFLLAIASMAFGRNGEQGKKVDIDPLIQGQPAGNGGVAPQEDQTPIAGPMGPQGPAGQPGEKGEPGSRGPRGQRGKPGTTRVITKTFSKSNHKGIDTDIKSWNPASVSYVDAKVGKLRTDLSSPSAPRHRGTASHPSTGGEDMSASTAVWVTIGVIFALVLIGTGVWWWGALGYRRRGLLSENHAQDNGYNPHAEHVNARFHRVTTRDKDELTVTPSDVAIAEANARIVVAEARVTETALRLENLRAMRQAVLMPVMAGGGGGYYVPQVAGGNTGGGAGPKAYTVDELTELGLIKSAKAAPKTTEEATPKATTVKRTKAATT